MRQRGVLRDHRHHHRHGASEEPACLSEEARWSFDAADTWDQARSQPVTEISRAVHRGFGSNPLQKRDPLLEFGIPDPIVSLTQQLEQSGLTLDGQDMPAESGQHRGISTQPRCRVDNHPGTATQKFREGMPTRGQTLERGSDTLPRPVVGPAKFQPMRALFKHDVG